MAAGPADFAPTATLAQLERRAAALASVREFFAVRAVMEVDPPALINAPVTDVNLHSARVQLPGPDPAATYALHTSPEYAMKRLLAAGSGDIYFLGHVFRGAERGRLHNPEFTLIEWYRRGFTLAQLMQEVAQLIERLCRRRFEAEHITYRAAFEREVGFDPLAAPDEVLRDAAARLGLPEAALATCTRDELLDLIMGAAVGPRLGRGRLTFVQGYPASQAALARLDPRDARVALRFELYSEGMELANGFDELADAAEQRARFEADQRERQRRGLPIGPLDERLLAALAAGLPPCAGVAVGFDRVLMLAEGAEHIDAVLPFTLECA
ncbi:MAG TPA: EF-P lysine aminoacylase EpmA [Steroidobacteraceae bacterium]|nr:EF-P lysine aminoacylase EpmA [Steroidobacteraceae bacterium]HNS26973.1 EF-P lysine aminoacylase EpmA [Steroidobacteraceae bacterium]